MQTVSTFPSGANNKMDGQILHVRM